MYIGHMGVHSVEIDFKLFRKTIFPLQLLSPDKLRVGKPLSDCFVYTQSVILLWFSVVLGYKKAKLKNCES